MELEAQVSDRRQDEDEEEDAATYSCVMTDESDFLNPVGAVLCLDRATRSHDS